jgi:hypothetical protein
MIVVAFHNSRMPILPSRPTLRVSPASSRVRRRSLAHAWCYVIDRRKKKVKVSMRLRGSLFVCLVVIAVGSEAAQKNPSNPIAVVGANGSIVIKNDVLRRTFEDGGAITEFEVVKLKKGYYLLRRGTTVSGVLRAEWIPLRSDARGRLRLPKIGGIVIVSCQGSGDCGTDRCELDLDASGCVCDTRQACEMLNPVLPGTHVILTQ